MWWTFSLIVFEQCSLTTNAENTSVTRAADAASCDVIVRMMTRKNVFVCALKENNGKFLPYETISALAK